MVNGRAQEWYMVMSPWGCMDLCTLYTRHPRTSSSKQDVIARPTGALRAQCRMRNTQAAMHIEGVITTVDGQLRSTKGRLWRWYSHQGDPDHIVPRISRSTLILPAHFTPQSNPLALLLSQVGSPGRGRNRALEGLEDLVTNIRASRLRREWRGRREDAVVEVFTARIVSTN